MAERDASWIYGPGAMDEPDEDGLTPRERRSLALEAGAYDTLEESDDA